MIVHVLDDNCPEIFDCLFLAVLYMNVVHVVTDQLVCSLVFFLCLGCFIFFFNYIAFCIFTGINALLSQLACGVDFSSY